MAQAAHVVCCFCSLCCIIESTSRSDKFPQQPEQQIFNKVLDEPEQQARSTEELEQRESEKQEDQLRFWQASLYTQVQVLAGSRPGAQSAIMCIFKVMIICIIK